MGVNSRKRFEPVLAFSGIMIICAGCTWLLAGKPIYNIMPVSAILAGTALLVVARHLNRTVSGNAEENAPGSLNDMYFAMMQNSRDISYRINLKTNKFDYISPSCQGIIGFTADELMRMEIESMLKLIHPDDLPGFTSTIADLGTTGKAEVEYRQQTKGGEYVWISNLTQIIRDENGIPLCRYGNLRDITRRKEAEEKLKASEQLYRAIGESIDYGVWVCDPDGRNIYASDSFLKLVGITQKQCSDFGWGDTLHPDDSEKTIAAWKECVKTGAKWDIEHRFRGVDGKWHPILARGIPIHDSSGRITAWAGINLDVSGLKAAEEAARASESLYKELVANARSIILKQDASGKITFFNHFAQEFFGFSEEEVLGKTAIETIVPEVASTGTYMPELIEKIIDDPDKYKLNINENIKKNGERVWIEWHNKALYNEEGKHVGHIAVGVDITESLKNKEALRDSEQRFRTIAETIPAMVCITRSSDSIILFTNEYNNKAFGIPGEEIVGTIGPDYYCNTADRAAMVEAFKRDGFVNNVQLQVKTKDGKPFWIITSVRPIVYGGQDCMIGASIDITEYKNGEIALETAREKLQIALENGNTGLWEWDLVNNVVIWDERMERMCGLAPGTFGKTMEAFEELIVEEDLPHTRKSINQALSKGIPFETVFRIKSHPEGIKYLNSKALLNRDKDGKTVSFSGVCFDITGLKKDSESIILKLNEELLRSNNDLQNFAYVASHDLQEPLRMVSSFSQLLLMQYGESLDDRAREYINFSVEGAKRMYDLLNGLLAYSRINTRAHEFTEVDLKEILELVIHNLSLVIHERDAILQFRELPVVFADRTQMIQLFQNLTNNAIKFSVEKPDILISTVEEKSHYVFSVNDKGIGIEPQYFERIFKIFQRLLPRDQYEGTGIGLAICRRIVERHGGRIWVESMPGKGSTFFFTIPKRGMMGARV
jgi:PAS domain S-box-containing protein